jgi:hypothetical protein
MLLSLGGLLLAYSGYWSVLVIAAALAIINLGLATCIPETKPAPISAGLVLCIHSARAV